VAVLVSAWQGAKVVTHSLTQQFPA